MARKKKKKVRTAGAAGGSGSSGARAAAPQSLYRAGDLQSLWQALSNAGTVEQFLKQQLAAQGFLVERKPTDQMSDKDKDLYKKALQREAAEKKKLAKEAWQARRKHQILHLGEGTFWDDAADWDKWDHEHAEERAAENALPRLEKPEQLAEALGISIPQLRWLCYHREAATRIHYIRFTIPKRSGGERAIWAPHPRLKRVQRWILTHVLERIPVHGAAHGFLTGRSIHTNAKQHTGARVVLKIDLKDFFPTITFRRVKGVFRKAGCRERIATLLAALCTESPREETVHEGVKYYVALGPRCLPQGAPTSPALTNALCLKMDQRLWKLAKKLGWNYTRYADDLTFSLPAASKEKPQLKRILGSVRAIVEAEGFKINPEKTRVARRGGRQAVTGLVVNGTASPRVPRTTRRLLRAAVHNLSQGKPLREGESLEKLRGLAAWVASSHPEEGRGYLAALAPGRG